MKAIIQEVIPGASVIDICSFGDKLITDETAKLYKKDKNLKKGIAFPTCVSINEVSTWAGLRGNIHFDGATATLPAVQFRSTSELII